MSLHTAHTRGDAATPRRRESPSDRLGLFRGLAIAIPIGLLLWIAIIRAAWWLWWW